MFRDYYDSSVDPHVGTKLGRTVLERLNVYEVKSGVTQNMSEGFNTVLRRMHEWKEATIDVCLLTLYQLQMFYHNSWILGCADRGDYHLLTEEFPNMTKEGT